MGRGRTHSFQDADGLLAEPDRVEHVVVKDGLEQVVLVVSLEGGLPSHHLVHQHPQGPPVHRGAILQLLQDLLGKRVRSGPAQDARPQPPPQAAGAVGTAPSFLACSSAQRSPGSYN